MIESVEVGSEVPKIMFNLQAAVNEYDDGWDSCLKAVFEIAC